MVNKKNLLTKVLTAVFPGTLQAVATEAANEVLSAAAEIDPRIMALAEKTGTAGVNQVQKGQDQIATGTLNVARGGKKIKAAQIFGFNRQP